MRSSLLSRRDLDFLLYEWLEVDKLTTRARFAEHSRETFDDVLDLSEQLATKYFAPHNKRNDAQEPSFDGERVHIIAEVAQAHEALAKAGLIGATLDFEHGGAQLPTTLAQASAAWFSAANIGTAGYGFLTTGNANLLVAHADPAHVRKYVGPMLAGRYFGTMCLSEPQAGSSLGDITTRAQPQQDGTYRLFGTKMWISGGDHEMGENIVHLVLAKIPGGPAGTKGISLFIVPRYLVDEDGARGERNDVALAGINHKMGYRGTVNTLLNFGEGKFTPGGAAGAVGYLVGQEHHGLSYMFHMMNEARIGVGLGAAALGYTGYLKALDYARTRPQGHVKSRPGGGQVPIVEHTDVKRMLLAQKVYAEGALALVLYCARLVDEQRTTEDAEQQARLGLLLDLLTPIAKSWPSQWCLQANSLAIQVHGGYGYTREYDVEQHYRDNRLNPIHEGTHGIQGLDLLGRKVVQREGASLRELDARVRATVAAARAAGVEAATLAAQLDSSWHRLIEVTGALWAGGDPETALANSSVYLETFGHIVLAWIWLEQFLATGTGTDDFHDGKRHAARYFFRHELPKTGPGLELLASLDTTARDMRTDWF
ncbi:acyl-CoA dehydrogenase [Nocardia panacis]|uniref:Acyl-CoA dehydrogenase n=1 Tax=Nocardia panacis TaxID=2340916 RepID=A0A3A4KDI6_9NOCA|nr:acyl-CoA dehydrogenase [Nocardia panacis]RJO73545.1 acyl-CoA dehydrogenase [Nocardia panacis]